MKPTSQCSECFSFKSLFLMYKYISQIYIYSFRLLFERTIVSRVHISISPHYMEISQQTALKYNEEIERSIGTYYRTKVFLHNINTIVDTSKSVSYIVHKLSFYELGDKIQLHIDLYNGYGVKKTNGGDDIRIVMVERSKNAGIAGHVVDHRNGSYTAHVICAWVGEPVIKIFVVPEEAKPYFFHVINETIPRNIWGGFKKGKNQHYSWCDAHTKILAKMYKEVCNLTQANYGIPWYCGRPPESNVTCDGWSFNTISRPNSNLPRNAIPNVTEAEMNMMSRYVLMTCTTYNRKYIMIRFYGNNFDLPCTLQHIE